MCVYKRPISGFFDHCNQLGIGRTLCVSDFVNFFLGQNKNVVIIIVVRTMCHPEDTTIKLDLSFLMNYFKGFEYMGG